MKNILFYYFKSILFLCLFSLIGTSCGSNLEKNDKYTIDEWIANNNGWVIKQLGSNLDEESFSIVHDTFGNIFVTGQTNGALSSSNNFGGSDIFLMKYDSSMTNQWSAQIGSSANDVANGIATDTYGNIYISGETKGNLDGNSLSGEYDAFLIKYDSSGVKQWTKTFGTSSTDKAFDVATDTTGNIYVVGNAGGDMHGNTLIGENSNLFLVKYNSSGTRQWTKLYGDNSSSLSATSSGSSVSIDSFGNVYAVGLQDLSLNGSQSADLLLLKYNSTGTLKWIQTLGSEDSGTPGIEVVSAVETDASGNIYVTGHTNKSFDGNTNFGGYDAFLVKYNSSGTRLWINQFGTSQEDNANAVVTDSTGNVFVVGWTNGSMNDYSNVGLKDAFIVKYESSGTKLLTKTFATSQSDIASGITIDSYRGIIWVSGTTGGEFYRNTSTGGKDIFIVRKLNY